MIRIGVGIVIVYFGIWIDIGVRIVMMIEVVDYDWGYDFGLGSGRRVFGSGYNTDDDCRGGGDCYEDMIDEWWVMEF